MTINVSELIEELKQLNPNKSITFFAPYGRLDEIEFEFDGVDEDKTCAWVSLKFIE